MRNIGTVFRRDAASYFASPTAYVVAAAFLVLAGYMFSIVLFATRLAEMRYTFGNLAITLLFVAPLLTMRAFAEERRQGTDELLLTSPVTLTELVLGKYLAVLSVFAAMLGVTLLYPAILLILGEPDLGPVAAGYLGLFLLGASFLAVGVFTSSLTENQVISAMVAFGILLFFWVLSWASGLAPGPLGQLAEHLSVLDRYADFERGVVDSSHVVYYLTFIGLFLFLTGRSIDQRRWS